MQVAIATREKHYIPLYSRIIAEKGSNNKVYARRALTIVSNAYLIATKTRIFLHFKYYTRKDLPFASNCFFFFFFTVMRIPGGRTKLSRLFMIHLKTAMIIYTLFRIIVKREKCNVFNCRVDLFKSL